MEGFKCEKSFIVTGGSGLLGNNFVRLLNKKGIVPKLLLLPQEDLTPLIGCQYSVAYGDVRDREFLDREIEENAGVFHFAGIIDITSNDKTLMYDVNVNGTKAVVDTCLQKKCRLLYTCSVHAIEEKKKNQIMAEPTQFNVDKIVGDYAKSKAMAASYFFEACKNGLDGVIIYPSGIIGANDSKVSHMGKLLIDIANKDIKTRVTGGYNFVDVEDVAEGAWAAFNSGVKNEGYVLCSDEITVDGIFKTVTTFLGRTGFIPKIATGFVKIFSSLAELYYKLKKQKPLFTKYSLYTITSNHNFCCDKARQQLNYCPKSAKQAVLESLVWYLENRQDLFKPFVLEEYEKAKKKQAKTAPVLYQTNN